MKMLSEGHILSKECIKPSSPTPPHSRTYKLSLFDQIVPPIYVPLVLYFPNPESFRRNSESLTQTLKQSLSLTLSRFYPLAGRLKTTVSIDCADQGVPFTVAEFDYRLSDFLRSPDPQASRSHIPSQLTWDEPGPGSHIAMVQVNHFACGGVAVGSLFLHKVADGVTVGTFMKAWAAEAGGGAVNPVSPAYTAQSLFPQNDSMKRESHLFSAMRRYFKFGKTRMRRYVFDSSAISKLRAEICGQENIKHRPTRVETVSAFLWKCFMTASSNSRIPEKTPAPISLITHGVNMRRKAETPLPEESFGNYVWLVPASASNDEPNRDLRRLFGKIRSAIGKVDVEFVERMRGEDGFGGYCENLGETWGEFPENADYLAISSWCNFGLYGIDFGWGRPVWITKCDGGSEVEWPYINVLWLMDTSEGDGIEAWITLEDKCFGAFDEIEDLRHLASVDPSPLDICSAVEKSSGVSGDNQVNKFI